MHKKATHIEERERKSVPVCEIKTEGQCVIRRKIEIERYN